MKEPHRTRAWRSLLGVLLLAITWLALNPVPPKAVDSGWDKLNHLAAFISLAVCAWRGFGSAHPRPESRRGGLALTTALLAYGLLIEVVQGFVPGRSAEAQDLMADALGIAIGWALHRGLCLLHTRRDRGPGDSGSV